MGITGLIPFLEKSSKKTNISEFSGKTVAIDTYCWLHKGAFSCADKIIMGQATDAYVKYCMKLVNMLLGHNIKPILVFDGRHLPAKAETEVKRRESRNANRKRAAELIKMGKSFEGKNLLRRSLDVSHKMALEVIKACQAHNIDCIVAPYEADAQLAYLNISGIADVVITEDSDLTLFGCKKIFFKMDMYGYGVLVEQNKLHLAMGLSQSQFHMDKFRHMCILSGCDYLASLPGIGLAKACKFIIKNSDENIYNALQRLGSSLNMKSLTVTKEYRDNFMRALVTFKHQLVYCPLRRKQVRLHSPPPDVTEEQLKYAGTEIDERLALQLALGNFDPFTKEQLHDFNPDSRQKFSNAWSETKVAKHVSIWSRNFMLQEVKDKKSSPSPTKEKKVPMRTSSTRGQVAVMNTGSLRKNITPKKRTFEESEMSSDEIIQMYKEDNKKDSTKSVAPKEKLETSRPEEQTSPVFSRRSNPFRKMDDSSDTSPSLLDRGRRKIPARLRFRPTVIDDSVIVQSKFFASEVKKDIQDEPTDVAESMTTNVDEEDCKENNGYLNDAVIIPESEELEEELQAPEQENCDKDSGYKGSSDGKDLDLSAMSCDNEIVAENEPLHLVGNVSPEKKYQASEAFVPEEVKRETNDSSISPREEENIEFSITRSVFSESKSSMFRSKNSIPSKRPRNSSSFQNSPSRSSPMQGSSAKKSSSKSITKKNGNIQGQSLLNMFGFQKKYNPL
ncbi:hypothetical protein QAD02_006765 [Eretmocerus hayati]|uniref:Uncharacterized protein n=1 Tax=Eretmocerus hayati TaxID=131215 RepID=A0ACC2N2X7_9HYME|nr:hypothetical protein QAD02_006765 [Eretmocerus hayati]